MVTKFFDTHPKSQHWDFKKNGDVNPKDVTLGSEKKFWFVCDRCFHSFPSAIYNITKGRNPSWCRYCSNKRLCENEKCDTCLKKSFAMHLRANKWNYEMNGDITPRNVFPATHKKFWFNCTDCECNHPFKTSVCSITSKKSIGKCPYHRKLCLDENCDICFQKSFASHPKEKYWDTEKNGDVKPRDVTLSSNKKYWFKCDECSHSFDGALNNIANKKNPRWCPCCANKKLCENKDCDICLQKSFTSHPKAKYWDNEKNRDVKPRDVFLSSNKKYWFQCDECSHSFDSVLGDITKEKNPQWCSFCTNKKLCDEDCNICLQKSFASHPKEKYWDYEKNRDVEPRDVFLSSGKKYEFICNECGHSFGSILNNVTNKKNPRWCPYCANQRLCKNKDCNICLQKSFASHPKAKHWDNEKNRDVKPRDVSLNSNKKYWFQCDEYGHSFDSTLNNVANKKNPRWCPHCKHKTERKLHEFLLSIKNEFHFTVVREYKADWCINLETGKHLRFDFYIVAKTGTTFRHKIVELDGQQHFKVVKHWDSCPKKALKRDLYKMKRARKNGCVVMRLVQEDVLSDRLDWKMYIKEYILSTEDEDIFISTDPDLYMPLCKALPPPIITVADI